MIAPFSGRCLCKATRFTCTAPPMWQGHCHCESCRRATAAPFTSFFGMAAGTWRWTGLSPVEYMSSPGVIRSRCGECGTPMAYGRADGGGMIDLFAATLDDPGSFRPEAHFFWSERLPWVPHDESLPHQAEGQYDWAAVLHLIQSAFAGMAGRIDPPSSMHHLTVDDIAAQAAEGEVWVIGTRPLACVFLTPAADHLYLGKLAVATGARARGMARCLVTLAQGRARAMGLTALQLSTRVELVENHAVFRKLGFSQIRAEAHPGFARPTTLIFRKEL